MRAVTLNVVASALLLAGCQAWRPLAHVAALGSLGTEAEFAGGEASLSPTEREKPPREEADADAETQTGSASGEETSGEDMAQREYKFRAFESESTLSIVDEIIVLIDENRAEAAALAAAFFLITSFFFGYGAGGVVDTLVGLIWR